MVNDTASFDNVIGPNLQSDETAAASHIPVLICGNVDLETAGIADKLHVSDHLG